MVNRSLVARKLLCVLIKEQVKTSSTLHIHLHQHQRVPTYLLNPKSQNSPQTWAVEISIFSFVYSKILKFSPNKKKIQRWCRTHWKVQSCRFLIHSNDLSYIIPFTLATIFSCILLTSSSLINPKNKHTNKK